MTYYADSCPCDYFGQEVAQGLRAIGWLDKTHEYCRGDVSTEFMIQLVSLLLDPWQPAIFAGRHNCELCRFSGGPPSYPLLSGTQVPLGSSNLFVPGDGFLYVAPSTVIHYMDAHEYSPPAEFQRAVMNCPPMRSIRYLKQIKDNASVEFRARFLRNRD